MRTFIIAAAATLVALAPQAASAQPGHHGPGIHRDDHRGPRWHNPRRDHVRHRRICRTVWHHHHRVRRCY